MQGGAVEAVDGVLGHLLLGGGTVGELVENFPALALVEGFFLADANHGSAVGAVGGAAEGHLVADGGPVDQPADSPHVRPGAGGVVEDRGVLGPAFEQLLVEDVAGGAEGFGGGVEVESVTGFVLHLSHENGLALEGRGAGNPVGFGLHADDFGVGVLGDLAGKGLAVLFGHPVAGFDAGVLGDELVEVGLLGFFCKDVLALLGGGVGDGGEGGVLRR